jgi:murein DD-endopeptidase MepM/ murein hydrolase activator NlpD
MKIIVSESQYKKIGKILEQESKLDKLLQLITTDKLEDDSDEDVQDNDDSEIDSTLDTTPKDKLTSPLKNFKVGSKFGITRKGLDTVRPHSGIDLFAQTGTELFSPGDGKVVKADMGENGGCGGSIWINHENGLESRFCHCSKINVKTGDNVKRGQLVGLTGGGKNDPGRGFSTGPHLHYTLAKNGQLIDPLNYIEQKFYDKNTGNLNSV